MKPVVSVKQTSDRGALMRRGLDMLTRQEVLVGIPADESARDGEPVSNAVIGYVQEHGSPAQNIPARPFLRPGIGAVQPEVATLLGEAAGDGLRGNPAGVTANLTKIGLLAVNAVRARFASNDWPALAPETLAARWRQENQEKVRQKAGDNAVPEKSKAPRRKKGESGKPKRTNPLVFWGQLRNAITYVIRRRGS